MDSPKIHCLIKALREDYDRAGLRLLEKDFGLWFRDCLAMKVLEVWEVHSGSLAALTKALGEIMDKLTDFMCHFPFLLPMTNRSNHGLKG